MLRALYAGAATIATPGLRLMLAGRARRGKEVAARLPERRGIDGTARPPGRLLWLHAASVGETVSVLPVLAALAQSSPEVTVLMTTGTVTSATLLARRLPELGLQARVLHRFVPLDVPAWTARFLDHWRPDAAAFVESEIWPNLLTGCRRRGIPTMLVNARLSARSFARWRRLPRLAQALFGSFDRLQAQSDGDAERLRALGAPPSLLTGNLKFAADPLPADAAELAQLRRLVAGRPVWLAASTHPGEEAALLEAHSMLARRHQRLLTIVVPRHPERGRDIAARAGSLAVARRSAGEGPPAGEGLWIADTLGELGLFYRLVGHAFVGRSLGEHGGQNPLEPARLGCAVAVGPNVENFRDPVAILEAAGALARVADVASLVDWVDRMLQDPARRASMGEAGMAASRRYADLPARVAAAVAELLPAGAGS
ncbi:3-deoxy-D-manno-octulosonic acid transferase [Limobrevibacterium gyesilva]|uniref:3-deoxy-D-manno-octulosonic acid transferase n=1 Tax=Limobrevibacterium gyesilva TaxID=2991712 RepID=A0AA42CG06_9PROT|nr:3-deoxy-D-manno-octulosonic acid transferase [Limobrevibacterium gyesilva]MCW3473345.1 3-deoxy-D-manno-octulosonic acid transferase [Limobrevibacterium gyesilva]